MAASRRTHNVEVVGLVRPVTNVDPTEHAGFNNVHM